MLSIFAPVRQSDHLRSFSYIRASHICLFRAKLSPFVSPLADLFAVVAFENQVTKSQSLTLVKNLVRVSISTVCHLRNIFPASCFQERSYGRSTCPNGSVFWLNVPPFLFFSRLNGYFASMP